MICFGYRVVVFHLIGCERARQIVLRNFTRDTAKVKSMIDTVVCVVYMHVLISVVG